jgi:hypothetical protein
MPERCGVFCAAQASSGLIRRGRSVQAAVAAPDAPALTPVGSARADERRASLATSCPARPRTASPGRRRSPRPPDELLLHRFDDRADLRPGDPRPAKPGMVCSPRRGTPTVPACGVPRAAVTLDRIEVRPAARERFSSEHQARDGAQVVGDAGEVRAVAEIGQPGRHSLRGRAGPRAMCKGGAGPPSVLGWAGLGSNQRPWD